MNNICISGWRWLVLVFVIITIQCNRESQNSKPNIVFIFADDLSYNTISDVGENIVHTPNLDRLKVNGTSFSHAYNMGGWNGAVCVASRAMLISGRSVWRAKEHEKKWKAKDSIALLQTWPQLMQSAGYDTYMTGKWHVAAKAEEIFDDARNVRPGMPPHFYDWPLVREYEKKGLKPGQTWADVVGVGYNRPLDENDDSWSPVDSSFGGFWEGGTHWSEVVRDDAIDFIEKSKESTDPFFMYLAFNAPHDHRQSPQKYIDMYPLDEINLPASFIPEYPYKDSMDCANTLRDEALAPFPRTPYAVKVHMQEYFAIISHLDDQIGLILDELEKTGKMDNTYIFFTADHGLSVGRHGLMGKQNMYDHSVRIPFIVSGPGIAAGEVLDSDIYLQDAMATSLDLANIEKPDYVDFRSLTSDLRGESEVAGRDEIYGCFTMSQRMIRKDGYKLIAYPRANKLRLFDMTSDPEELNDLAGDPIYSDKVKALLGQLVDMQRVLDDDLDIGFML